MKHGFYFLFALFALSLSTSPSFADCVMNAKSKTSFVLLDSHTILLKDGPGSDILIKTYSFIPNNSNIVVLKDDFCSYDNSVLYIDGEVTDVTQVKKI